jgi:hypothetical protein
MELLLDKGITHVYIGQQQATVNTDMSLIFPDELLDSLYYQPVYHQDNVWIFTVKE